MKLGVKEACASMWISIWGACILFNCGLPDKVFWNYPPCQYTHDSVRTEKLLLAIQMEEIDIFILLQNGFYFESYANRSVLYSNNFQFY